MPVIKLCTFDEMNEVDSRGFFITDVSPARNIFIVRDKDKVLGYANQCPHTMGPLDWSPDQFLDYDKEYIQCANHGALFNIQDGKCIYGPCVGQSLWPVKVKVEDNVVFAIL